MRETKSRISYIAAATIDSIKKTLNLADVSSFSPCAIILLRIVESESSLSNTEILVLLVVRQTHNLSRIKFAHVWRQVEGLCIS